MGILDKLTKNGSNFSKHNGATPDASIDKLRGSKLHNEYSINGTPNIPNKPQPSEFDPTSVDKYLDNLPG